MGAHICDTGAASWLAKLSVVADQETSVTPAALKITVSASGRILLQDREVDLHDLEAALQTAKAEGALVEYDRENPASPAPPEAEAVLKLIGDHKLRLALAPRTESERSSNVVELPGPEHFFAKVRRRSAAHRGVSLVRPDRTLFALPAPPPGAISARMLAGVKAVIPSEEPRNIAAIAPPGTLAAAAGNSPTLPDLGRQVPFFGLLIGLAYTGHAVWIFEASALLFPAGCEDADVLLVDSDAIVALPPDWLEDAGGLMRNANILIYDRTRQKLGAARTAGVIPGRIEFLT